MLDAIHENSDINMEITFIANPSATELLGNKSVGLNIPTINIIIIIKKTFCGFSTGRNQYWAGRVYDLCVYYMTGTPEGSTESGFMEKPGIEPATPGLQGIALIHYTTGS